MAMQRREREECERRLWREGESYEEVLWGHIRKYKRIGDLADSLGGVYLLQNLVDKVVKVSSFLFFLDAFIFNLTFI